MERFIALTTKTISLDFVPFPVDPSDTNGTLVVNDIFMLPSDNHWGHTRNHHHYTCKLNVSCNDEFRLILLSTLGPIVQKPASQWIPIQRDIPLQYYSRTISERYHTSIAWDAWDGNAGLHLYEDSTTHENLKLRNEDIFRLFYNLNGHFVHNQQHWVAMMTIWHLSIKMLYEM